MKGLFADLQINLAAAETGLFYLCVACHQSRLGLYSARPSKYPPSHTISCLQYRHVDSVREQSVCRPEPGDPGANDADPQIPGGRQTAPQHVVCAVMLVGGAAVWDVGEVLLHSGHDRGIGSGMY